MTFAVLPLCLVLMCLAMAWAWHQQRVTQNDGWADAVWALSVGGVGVVAALWPVESDSGIERRALVAFLIAAWSLRLGLHILKRTLKGKSDERYGDLRKQWGADAEKRMFLFLQSQAIAGFVLVVAVFFAAHRNTPLFQPQDMIGIALVLAGIWGEAAADRQLREFAQEPANKNKVCDAGFWRYSRHPNYFFEWLSWCGFAAIAIDFTYQNPWTLLAFLAPAMMYYLLRFVSGIPPLEKHMLESRGEAFREYQRKTSEFFLAPPRA